MPSLINSDDGVVSGSAGLKTTGSNDGILALQNNGTTNVTVTAAGDVGIGTASPASKLHVTGLARICDPAAYILFRNAADSTSNGVVQFPDAGEASIVNYRNTDLTLGTNNNTRVRITAAGLFQFNSGYGSVATAYGCRAWVNFNGTGTVAIRASGNVSSITDNGTGNYTVNFTAAMPDASYAFSISAGRYGATFPVPTGGRTVQPTTSSMQIYTTSTDGASGLDPEQVSFSIFR